VSARKKTIPLAAIRPSIACLEQDRIMSAKPHFRPFDVGRAQFSANASSDGLERALVCIRQIQSSAEQICGDAADIEDARFLAENIVNACRQVLANGQGTLSKFHRTHGAQTDSPVTGAPPENNADSSNYPAGQGKLGSLSARELEIFRHLAEGSSAAEIAVALSRSSKTINNHRTRILQKLGLKNATELVRLAVRSGLVSV
jgi:DNA-binding NarL/FixJ family response regulator